MYNFKIRRVDELFIQQFGTCIAYTLIVSKIFFKEYMLHFPILCICASTASQPVFIQSKYSQVYK